MKPLAIAGILLVVLGAFIVFRGLSYGSQRSVLRVGDVRVTAEGERTIPAWVGAGAIIGGVLLVAGAGLRNRRGA
jgi:drug/metabolite transporter (DMT)-like permease